MSAATADPTKPTRPVVTAIARHRAIHPAAIESLGFSPALAAVGVIVWSLMIALIWWATKPETNDRNA